MEKPNSELFGSWVVYSHILKRKMRCVETENKYKIKFRNDFKFWKKFECPGSGIFLGTRTLKNGNREFGWEEGYAFTPTEYLTAALICPSPNQNPVYVPMEAFRPIETWPNQTERRKMSRIDRLEIAMEVLVDHNMLEEAEKLERIAMARTDYDADIADIKKGGCNVPGI